MPYEKPDLRVLTEKEEATRKRRQENTVNTEKEKGISAGSASPELQRRRRIIAENIEKDRAKGAIIRRANKAAAEARYVEKAIIKINEAEGRLFPNVSSTEGLPREEQPDMLDPNRAKEADDAADAKKIPSKWENLWKMFKM